MTVTQFSVSPAPAQAAFAAALPLNFGTIAAVITGPDAAGIWHGRAPRGKGDAVSPYLSTDELNRRNGHDRVEDARAVRLEDELATRGIMLRGRGADRCGPCPVCGGVDRFSINIKKQVWNCRGCSTGGDVIALVEHLDGSGFMEAVETLAGAAPAAKRVQQTKKTYFDYHDAQGAVVYQVERTDYCDGHKKTFRQRRPDPARPGEWLWNLVGVRPVPYRLPGVIEAAANGHMIVIAEGEAKVDLLWRWNIPATCNSGGAQKWKAEHSAYLSGADIVILPDNDPAGRLHLDAVAVSLRGAGATVRILDLPGLVV